MKRERQTVEFRLTAWWATEVKSVCQRIASIQLSPLVVNNGPHTATTAEYTNISKQRANQVHANKTDLVNNRNDKSAGPPSADEVNAIISTRRSDQIYQRSLHTWWSTESSSCKQDTQQKCYINILRPMTVRT
jgi:hypothetical protein